MHAQTFIASYLMNKVNVSNANKILILLETQMFVSTKIVIMLGTLNVDSVKNSISK